jgi:hypothetical protein
MGVKLGTDNNWAIKDGNLLAYNDASGRFFNKEFDFARGSRATYVGRDGLIKNSGEQPTNLVQNGDFSQLGSELLTQPVNLVTDFNANGGGVIVDADTFTTSGGSLDGIKKSFLVVGKRYKLVVSGNTTSSGFSIGNISASGNEYGSGFGTHYFTALSTGLWIRQATAGTTNITEFSVKQVDPNDEWSLGAGWSIGEDKAIFDGGSDSNLVSYTNVDNGKSYKYSFTISNMTNGALSFRLGSSSSNDLRITTDGTYTGYALSDGTSIVFRAESGFDGSITNISVQEIDTNTPRIDFTDDVNGHLLLEPQRTNSLLQSNQFDTTWALSGATLTSGQIGVGGSSDAWLLEKNAPNGRVFQNLTSSGSQTYSVYAKSGTNNWVFLLINGGGNPTAYFDLQNGVLGATSGGVITSSIESAGNGWYRISMTFNESITRVRLYVADSDGYSGETSGSIYIQSAQLEQGSYATSIIPTYGSAQTRLGETCNNSGSAQDFNSAEGVLYAEFEDNLLDEGNFRLISINNDASNSDANSVAIGFKNTGDFYFRVKSPSGSYLSQLIDANLNQFYKVALKYKSEDIAIWINGVEVETSTLAFSFAAVLDNLSFDYNGNGGLPFYGKVKDLQVFTTALTDAELIALTTI